MSKAPNRTDSILYGKTGLTPSEVSRYEWREALAAKVAITLGVKKEEI